jgi:hypothetical protein
MYVPSHGSHIQTHTQITLNNLSQDVCTHFLLHGIAAPSEAEGAVDWAESVLSTTAHIPSMVLLY